MKQDNKTDWIDTATDWAVYIGIIGGILLAGFMILL